MILTAAAVKSRSLAVTPSGSVSFPLSRSSFITLGKRSFRTSFRCRKIQFRCGISGATKRRRTAGNSSKRNLVISTSMGRFVTALVHIVLWAKVLPTKTWDEMR
ncbi:hypothetical protein OCU04_004280 [Sclerotinia nivalis]|uniref:Uncharacterized protein n=1 Tax=Sclerotinia nivalis TaxID=352851 RepID=A0A9X0AQG9_9HELO|nr:hypothetical protein OCU04_004280 [Sclerotinia nivalis]